MKRQRARVTEGPDPEPLAKLVVALTEQGFLFDDIVEAIQRGKLGKLERNIAQLTQGDHVSSDVLALGCAVYWNEAVVKYATGDNSWSKAQRASKDLCQRAYDQDHGILRRSSLVADVLKLRQSASRGVVLNNTSSTSRGPAKCKRLKSLAGFPLGASGPTLRSRCEAAGYDFKRTATPQCSGPATSDYTGRVEFKMCGRTSCETAVHSRPNPVLSKPWEEQLSKLKRRYTGRYGDPKTEKHDLPYSCTHTLPRCVRTGKVSLDYRWTVDDSEVRLQLGMHEGEPTLTVRHVKLP